MRVRPALCVGVAFSDRQQQKFFTEEIQGDATRLGMPAGFGGLTMPFSSGISHAHAGLAKLRPPLPSTSFHSRQQRRPPVTPGSRVSRNEGRERIRTELLHTANAG
jgi:hypothetical protein